MPPRRSPLDSRESRTVARCNEVYTWVQAPLGTPAIGVTLLTPPGVLAASDAKARSTMQTVNRVGAKATLLLSRNGTPSLMPNVVGES
jgi:hypothetical protein